MHVFVELLLRYMPLSVLLLALYFVVKIILMLRTWVCKYLLVKLIWNHIIILVWLILNIIFQPIVGVNVLINKTSLRCLATKLRLAYERTFNCQRNILKCTILVAMQGCLVLSDVKTLVWCVFFILILDFRLLCLLPLFESSNNRNVF